MRKRRAMCSPSLFASIVPNVTPHSDPSTNNVALDLIAAAMTKLAEAQATRVAKPVLNGEVVPAFDPSQPNHCVIRLCSKVYEFSRMFHWSPEYTVSAALAKLTGLARGLGMTACNRSTTTGRSGKISCGMLFLHARTFTNYLPKWCLVKRQQQKHIRPTITKNSLWLALASSKRLIKYLVVLQIRSIDNLPTKIRNTSHAVSVVSVVTSHANVAVVRVATTSRIHPRKSQPIR